MRLNNACLFGSDDKRDFFLYLIYFSLSQYPFNVKKNKNKNKVHLNICKGQNTVIPWRKEKNYFTGQIIKWEGNIGVNNPTRSVGGVSKLKTQSELMLTLIKNSLNSTRWRLPAARQPLESLLRALRDHQGRLLAGVSCLRRRFTLTAGKEGLAASRGLFTLSANNWKTKGVAFWMQTQYNKS